jgi:hypothetical protein
MSVRWVHHTNMGQSFSVTSAFAIQACQNKHILCLLNVSVLDRRVVVALMS